MEADFFSGTLIARVLAEMLAKGDVRMKPLRIVALAVALIGLSAWDTVLPIVLPAIAGVFLALGEGLSRRDRRQQRIRQMLERQYAAAPPPPMPLELAMDETALTLVRLAAPAPVGSTPVGSTSAGPAPVWEVAPATEEAPAGAEVIQLDRYRTRHAPSPPEGTETVERPPVPDGVPLPTAAPINAASISVDRPLPRDVAAMQRRLSERVDALRGRSIALRQPAALLAETTADETTPPP